MESNTQPISEIKCSFKEICQTAYGDKLDEVCFYRNPNISQCQLTKDIQTKDVNDFIKNLLNKKVKASKEKNKEPVSCPRSLLARAALSKKCVIEKCPFYSTKMSYNCMLIHHSVFFPEHPYLPQNVLEIGVGIESRFYSRLVEISIFMSRLYIVLLKYRTDVLHVDSINLESKNIKMLLTTDQHEGICDICGSVMTNRFQCTCVQDSCLRDLRIKFGKNWKRSIEKCEDVVDYEDLNLQPKDFVEKYNAQLYNLKFIRSLLGGISIDTTKLIDVPFGYIYRTYHELFDEVEWKKAENLGLSEELNEKAYYYFLVETIDRSLECN